MVLHTIIIVSIDGTVFEHSVMSMVERATLAAIRRIAQQINTDCLSYVNSTALCNKVISHYRPYTVRIINGQLQWTAFIISLMKAQCAHQLYTHHIHHFGTMYPHKCPNIIFKIRRHVTDALQTMSLALVFRCMTKIGASQVLSQFTAYNYGSLIFLPPTHTLRAVQTKSKHSIQYKGSTGYQSPDFTPFSIARQYRPFPRAKNMQFEASYGAQ